MSHQTISFIKSGLRICGYLMLLDDTFVGVIFLVVSEIWGVYEEVGER